MEVRACHIFLVFVLKTIKLPISKILLIISELGDAHEFSSILPISMKNAGYESLGGLCIVVITSAIPAIVHNY